MDNQELYEKQCEDLDKLVTEAFQEAIKKFKEKWPNPEAELDYLYEGDNVMMDLIGEFLYGKASKD